MADKKPTRKAADALPKKKFDIKSLKKSLNLTGSNKEKEITWIPLSEAFTKAVKLPGIARGFSSLFRGYSNTGKSTAIYEAVAGAQQVGDFPIIIETEGNWNWEHAKNIGVKFEEVVDESTGEIDYEGDFLLIRGTDLLERYANYDYTNSKEGSKALRKEPVVEDVARFIEDMLELQDNGDFDRDICFLWDSIGTLNCFKGTQSKTSNNMWTAGAMEASFKSFFNFKLPASRIQSSKYTNTFAAVQKVWLDNMNTVIKHKGGEAAYYGARLIFHFGGILTHSTTKLKATSKGNDFQFGIETRISCEKNQITGIEEKGKICSTPHGYVSPEDLDSYKKSHGDFFRKALNCEFGDDIQFITEEVTEAADTKE